MRFPFSKETLPDVGSKSPDKIFKNVDLPAHFAPMIPYQFQCVNIVFTSSNKMRLPN